MANQPERELLILRHAKSAWDGGAESDFDRPLDKQGILSCHVVARKLMDEKLLPDLVLSSSAVRATQTVLRIAKQARISMSQIKWNPNLYSSSTDIWLKSLQDAPAQTQRILICGHNPELEQLLELLCVQPAPPKDDGKVLSSASLAHLRVLVPWSEVGEKCATLVSISRPNDATVPVDV